MIEIQSVCGGCRAQLSLESADLLVLQPLEDQPDREPRLLHGCAECGATTVRTITAQLAQMLARHGTPSLPDLELEPAVEEHPEHPPTGQPWSADDVIDLHDLLARDGWFEALLASGPTT